MKINPKTNRTLFLICIIHIALLILIILRRENHVSRIDSLSLWINILSDITFLLPLTYLSVILKFAREKKYIVSLFFAYAIIEILNFTISYISFNFNTNYIISIVLGIIISLFMICIIIISFNIKCQELRVPFRFFAFVYILMLITNWGIPLLMPLMVGYQVYFKITGYIIYTHYIPILAIAYIIYVSGKLFRSADAEELVTSQTDL